jgi:hypothetical protein
MPLYGDVIIRSCAIKYWWRLSNGLCIMHHGKRDSIFLPVLRPQQQDCTLMCSKPCGIQRSRSRCSTGGGLAQLGEHYVRNVGVGGSTPLPSTKHHPHSQSRSSDHKEVNHDEARLISVFLSDSQF